MMQGEKALAVSQPFSARSGLMVDLRFPADHAGFLPLRAVLTDAQGHGDAALATVMAVQDPLHLLYMGERQAGRRHGSRLCWARVLPWMRVGPMMRPPTSAPGRR
jgi:hypothetical protein